MRYTIKSFQFSPIWIIVGAFLTSPFIGHSQTSGNPIFAGWYADPEGIIFEDQYWIYPTYSGAYDRQVFLDAFSSSDLITWTKHSRILDTAAVSWADSAMWAPSIIKKGEQYFLFFAANDIQSNQAYGGIGVAVADLPQGPYKDWLGRPLIGEIINGAQPIDQFVFKEGSDYYMIYGGWRHCNIVRLKDDFTGIVPHEDGSLYKEITPKGYVEGPFVFKRNGKYYFMWSEGGWGGPNYRVAYAMADSPLGPFERIGTVLQQDPEVATGAGHHSLIHKENTDDWYIVYHRRPLSETHHNHRVVCIDRLYFDENGLIQPVKITYEGVTAAPLK